MNKKVITYGLVGSMLVAPLMPIQAAAQSEELLGNAVISQKTEDLTEQTNNNEATKEDIMELSLEESIEYALENSKDVEIQKIELQKAELAYDQNIKDIKESEKNVGYIPTRNPFTGEVIEDASVSKALIEYRVPRRSTELAYQSAKWNLEMKENQIKYNVEKAYFDLLQMKKELEIAKENLNLSQKQYNNGQLKYDLGTISQQQLLGLEMGLLQARSIYDSTEIYYDLQLMSFQNTLGLPFNQEVALTDTIEYKEHEAIDLQESVKQALENNVGVKMSQEGYELSELTLKAVKVRYPEITYRYREQEAEVAKSAKNLETAQNGIEMGVRAAYLNLLTAEKQIKTLEKTVEQAEETVRLAEISFDLGQNTSTEVSQANINLMNAKKNLSKQIHAYNMALLDYEYSIGIGKGF